MFYKCDFPDFIALSTMSKVLQEIAEYDFEKPLENASCAKLEYSVEGARDSDNMQAGVDRVMVTLDVINDKSLQLIHSDLLLLLYCLSRLALHQVSSRIVRFLLEILKRDRHSVCKRYAIAIAKLALGLCNVESLIDSS